MSEIKNSNGKFAMTLTVLCLTPVMFLLMFAYMAPRDDHLGVIVRDVISRWWPSETHRSYIASFVALIFGGWIFTRKENTDVVVSPIMWHEIRPSIFLGQEQLEGPKPKLQFTLMNKRESRADDVVDEPAFEFVLDLKGSRNCAIDGPRVNVLQATGVAGPGETVGIGTAFAFNPAQPWHVNSGFQCREFMRKKKA